MTTKVRRYALYVYINVFICSTIRDTTACINTAYALTTEGKQFWRVAPSKLRPTSRTSQVALGLFAVRAGRHVIRFQGEGVKVMSTKSIKRWQRKYAIDSGRKGDKVIVPASEEKIFYGFHAQYRDDRPTHKLCWCDDPYNEHGYLQPIKDVRIGEEVSFTYYV